MTEQVIEMGVGEQSAPSLMEKDETPTLCLMTKYYGKLNRGERAVYPRYKADELVTLGAVRILGESPDLPADVKGVPRRVTRQVEAPASK